MDDLKLPGSGEEPQPEPIADASALFHQDSDASPQASPPTGPVAAAGGESYDVAEAAPPPVTRGAPASASPSPPSARSKPARATLPEESKPLVEPVWTRTAEWGMTILILAATGLVVLIAVYALLSFEEYGLAFLALVLGGLALVLLSYPILITLERPVRVTPEQAVRDFYNALSHHVPHYRRMWLLLSNAGKFGGSFATFDGFRNYWKNRLRSLRQGRASPITPLKFVVDEFKGPRSAGLETIPVGFVVRVSVRGKQAEGPVEVIRVEATLVKGPDRMWYLDRGTLP